MAVLAAVAVRLLTPLGWMPNPAAGGSLLVICTGDGSRLAIGSDLPGHGPHPLTPHDQCVFAGASLVDGPEPVLVPAPPTRVALAAAAPLAPPAIWRGRDEHRQQLPRGPPQQV